MRELDKILSKTEKVFWEGQPRFWPFLFDGSVVTTVFGVFWMLCLTPFIWFAALGILSGSSVFGIGVVFLVPFILVGLWAVIGIPIYQILVCKHTYYAITDRRVILQTGLIGRDFEIVDLDQITDAEVNVGLFDTIFGGGDTGSIIISHAGSVTQTSKGVKNYPATLRSIDNPYEVFKFFTKVSHDVKTDIQYPNKLRPTDNPGYQTSYDPNKQ